MDEKEIRWSHSALEMVAEIHSYKAEWSEKGADQYINDLLENIEKLRQNAEACAPCRNPKLQEMGLRCCLFEDHVIVYEVNPKQVDILAVIHARRNPDTWDETLK